MRLITITLLFLGFLIYSHDSAAQGVYRDVVYLKNGSIIKGIVVEMDDPDSIGIKTADGSLFVYKNDEVDSIQKEEVRYAPYPPAMHYNYRDYKRKEPAVSFLFSLLIPGGGQYYNGQYGKGAVMTGICIGSLAMIIAGAVETEEWYGNGYYHYSNRSDALIGIGAAIYFGNYLWSLIDAPIVSNRINKMTRIQLGNNTTLSIKPDYSFNKEPFMNGKSGLNPTIGMKLSLDL